MYEHVMHPTHYNHEGRKECWDEWVDKFGANIAVAICLGCADKYMYRAGTKMDNSENQDVRKAVQFCKKADSLIDIYKDEIDERTLQMREIVKNEVQAYAEY